MEKALVEILHTRDAGIRDLKRLPASLLKWAGDAKYECDGVRVRLQQLQRKQQKLQAVVSSVQREISALATIFERDRDYSI